MVKQITANDFDIEVLKSDIPVVVDFFATWCGPCMMMAPIVEKISEKYEGKIKFCKLDTDQAGEIAAGYRIMSIPTILCFKGGEVVNKSIGAIPEAKFDELVSTLL